MTTRVLRVDQHLYHASHRTSHWGTAPLGHTGSMHELNDSVTLRSMTAFEASDITAGNRPRAGWADDFPGNGDVIAARYFRAVSTHDAPWRASWLILVNGLVSGTVGFKSEPRERCLEVGYGVVPSERHHGVATAALAQLLAMLEGRGLSVRAETDASNVASQSVLRRLAFEEVARRDDAEGESLIVWERHLDQSD
jgi:RimJ/RimL family protein N-acetyltransferase